MAEEISISPPDSKVQIKIDPEMVAAITATRSGNDVKVHMRNGREHTGILLCDLSDIVDAVRAAGVTLMDIRPEPDAAALRDRNGLMYINPAALASVSLTKELYKYDPMPMKTEYSATPPVGLKVPVEKIKCIDLNVEGGSGITFSSLDILPETEADFMAQIATHMPGMVRVYAGTGWTSLRAGGYSLLNPAHIVRIEVEKEKLIVHFSGETEGLDLMPYLPPKQRIEDVRADWRLAEAHYFRVRDMGRTLAARFGGMIHIQGLRDRLTDIFILRSGLMNALRITVEENALRYFFQERFSSWDDVLRFKGEKYLDMAMSLLAPPKPVSPPVSPSP